MVSLQVFFFLFEVPFFKTTARRAIHILVIILYSLFYAFEGRCSMFQALVSLSLSYIVFFISLYVKFIYFYIADAFSLITSLTLVIVFSKMQSNENYDLIVHLIDALLGSAITLYLLIRYHVSYKGFNEIQGPSDIIQELNARFGSYVRQVNVGIVYDYSTILKNDLVDEFICLFVIVIIKSVAVATLKNEISLFLE